MPPVSVPLNSKMHKPNLSLVSVDAFKKQLKKYFFQAASLDAVEVFVIRYCSVLFLSSLLLLIVEDCYGSGKSDAK